MLVLSRRPREAVVLPSLGVRFQVMRIEGNVVRLGIDAPVTVSILREELQEIAANQLADAPDRASHAFRNQLNKICLGLSLARQQMLNGRTEEADRSLAKALTVLDTLEKDWTKTRAASSRRPSRPAQRCRTLVVEDNGNERELLASLLSLSGCECAAAADGEAALEYLSTHEPPDFILLDMRMPRRDGPATLREIRKDPRFKGLKVFALSGATPGEYGIQTGPDGVDAWFTKPLNPGKLWEAMRLSLATGTN